MEISLNGFSRGIFKKLASFIVYLLLIGLIISTLLYIIIAYTYSTIDFY